MLTLHESANILFTASTADKVFAHNVGAIPKLSITMQASSLDSNVQTTSGALNLGIGSSSGSTYLPGKGTRLNNSVSSHSHVRTMARSGWNYILYHQTSTATETVQAQDKSLDAVNTTLNLSKSNSYGTRSWGFNYSEPNTLLSAGIVGPFSSSGQISSWTHNAGRPCDAVLCLIANDGWGTEHTYQWNNYGAWVAGSNTYACCNDYIHNSTTANAHRSFLQDCIAARCYNNSVSNKIVVSTNGDNILTLQLTGTYTLSTNIAIIGIWCDNIELGIDYQKGSLGSHDFGNPSFMPELMFVASNRMPIQNTATDCSTVFSIADSLGTSVTMSGDVRHNVTTPQLARYNNRGELYYMLAATTTNPERADFLGFQSHGSEPGKYAAAIDVTETDGATNRAFWWLALREEPTSATLDFNFNSYAESEGLLLPKSYLNAILTGKSNVDAYVELQSLITFDLESHAVSTSITDTQPLWSTYADAVSESFSDTTPTLSLTFNADSYAVGEGEIADLDIWYNVYPSGYSSNIGATGLTAITSVEALTVVESKGVTLPNLSVTVGADGITMPMGEFTVTLVQDVDAAAYALLLSSTNLDLLTDATLDIIAKGFNESASNIDPVAYLNVHAINAHAGSVLSRVDVVVVLGVQGNATVTTTGDLDATYYANLNSVEGFTEVISDTATKADINLYAEAYVKSESNTALNLSILIGEPCFKIRRTPQACFTTTSKPTCTFSIGRDLCTT